MCVLRAGMIFYRRGARPASKKGGAEVPYDFEQRINAAVFPGLQGGPHDNQVGAMAVALKQVHSRLFQISLHQFLSSALVLYPV